MFFSLRTHYDRFIHVRDLAYLRSIAGIDPEKVGSLLSYGAHHRVYTYGKQEVIKVPVARFAFLYSTSSHLEQDLLLLKKHCPWLLVPTKVYANNRHTHHCVVQKRVVGQTLTASKMHKHQAEFSRVLRANAVLIKQHRSAIDLVGGEGVLSCFRSVLNNAYQPYFSNILLVDGQIKLLDCELLRLSYTQFSGAELVRYFLSVVTHVANQWFLHLTGSSNR